MSNSRSGILNSFLYAIICSEFVNFIKPLDAYSSNTKLSYSLELATSLTVQKTKEADIDLIHINDAIIDILKQRQFPLYVDVVLQLENSKILQELEKKQVKLDLKVHAEPLFHETLASIVALLKTNKYYVLNEALASAYFFSSDYHINKKILLEYVLPYVIIFSAHEYLKVNGSIFANFCSDLKAEIDQSFVNFDSCKRPIGLPDRIDRLEFHLKMWGDDDEILPPEEAIKKAQKQNAFIDQLLKMNQDRLSVAKLDASSINNTQSCQLEIKTVEMKPEKIKINSPQNKTNVPTSKGLYQQVLKKNHLSQIQLNDRRAEDIPDAAPIEDKREMRKSAPIKLLNQHVVADHFQAPEQNTPRNNHKKLNLHSSMHDIAKMPMMPKPIKINERNLQPRHQPEPYVNTTKIKNIALNTLSHLGTGLINQLTQVKQLVTNDHSESEKQKKPLRHT